MFKKIAGVASRKSKDDDAVSIPDDIPQDEEPEYDEDIPEDPEPIEEEEPEYDEPITEETPKVIMEGDGASSDVKSLLSTVSESEPSRRRTRFEEFVDERLLVSMDALGNKQMKIKVLDVSDEHPPVQWRFGDRIKITKILVTIKHLSTQEVEEGEFDIEAIERELAEKTPLHIYQPLGSDQ